VTSTETEVDSTETSIELDPPTGTLGEDSGAAPEFEFEETIGVDDAGTIWVESRVAVREGPEVVCLKGFL
jgi:hypothetical protein